jgi:hypothetical protein
MNGMRSRGEAIKFLEFLEKEGTMAPATARARKAALNVVLSILDSREAEDVTSIDLDEVMHRFELLQGKAVDPNSIRTYRGRVKSALADFASYLENPLGFRPNIQIRERKSPSAKPDLGATGNAPEASTPDFSRNSGSAGRGPMANSILPIPIRADLVIRIHGLPFDLTEAEANKIAGVIQAMAV